MKNNIHNIDKPSILKSIAGVTGLIAAFLYFAGWIYRWQYYSFFQLEITSLDFPAESFLFVPLQVFFGSHQAVFKTIFAILVATILIDLALWLVENLKSVQKSLEHNTKESDKRQGTTASSKSNKQKSWIAKIGLSRTLLSFIEEIIVVGVILAALYFLAKTQGFVDARRDAINNSSTLPVVSLIVNEEKTVLGRKLDDLFTNPSLEGYRIFGDKGLFDDVRGTELNDFYNREQPRVWRLLTEQESWIYLIRTLPSNAEVKTRPPVLAIQKTFGDHHLMILSPEPITPYTPQYITPKPVPVTPEQPETKD